MLATSAIRIVRRSVLIVGGVCVILSSAAQARTPVQVEPSHGGAHTRFTISFRTPISTTSDPFNESYEVGVKGPAHSDCAKNLELYTSSGHGLRKGQLVRVHARSPYRHARWCTGLYSGTIREFSVNPSSTCEQEPTPPGCAEVATLIAVFRFRVP